MSIDLEAVGVAAEELELFHSVEGVVSGADAMTYGTAPPKSAYVSTARETAEPNKMTGRHRQRITQTVSILFTIAGERLDGARNDELEQVKNALLERFAGWRPPGADSVFQYVSFQVVQIADGLIWGESLFAAPYHFTK